MLSFEAHNDVIILNGELKVPIHVFKLLEPEYGGLPPGYSIHHYIPGISNTVRGDGVLGNNLPGIWDAGDRYIARIEEFRRLLDGRRQEEFERQAIMSEVKFARLPYTEQRLQKYPPINDLVVALWEMIVEGRSEGCDKIQALRSEIKSKYPKQEG
jgi:hypothetical protein